MIQDAIVKRGMFLGFFLTLLPFVCGATPRAEVYYEDGAGLADHWGVEPRTPGLNVFTDTSDPPGATVTESGGSIVTSGSGANGMENSYQLYAWEASYGDCEQPIHNGSTENCINNNMQRVFNFDIRSSGMFAVYVYVDTNLGTSKTGYNPYERGKRVLKYTPEDINAGGAAVSWTSSEKKLYGWWLNEYYNSHYGHDYCCFDSWTGYNYHYGLGSDKQNGNWHSISRNIEDDIHNLAPGAGVNSIKKIVVQGNVRMNNVELDFDSDMWDKYEQYQIDPNWAYDSGWLDSHDGYDNPAGIIQCLPVSGYRDDCSQLWNYDFNNCSGIYKKTRSDLIFDGSGLPSPINNECYLTMMSKYTYDGLNEGVQQHEIVVGVLENSSGTQTFTIDDPGQGPQKVTVNEPLTLVQGPNTFHFKSPGYCGEGESVHFGRETRATYFGHGDETKSQDAFRIKCGPAGNALNINISANPNPLIQTGADTSLITWDSQNAKRCVPFGGYYNSVTSTNDWQGMGPSWADVTLLPGYSAVTSSFSTTAYNAVALPPTPLFTTNPIPYSVTYALECHDQTDTTSILKSETIAVYGPGCWDDPTCENFTWMRVNSRNDSGNDYRYNDPLCHPGWTTDGTCEAAPTNPNGYVLKDQDFDNDVVMDPIRVHYSAGNHTIVFKRREQGATLDKILVTPVAGGITPSGKGGSGTVGNSVWMDAEDGTVNYGSDWQDRVYDDYTASGYKAVNNQLWDETITRVDYYRYGVEFDVNIPAAGDYYIWARVGTKNPGGGGGDSFWVAPDWIDSDGDNYLDERYDFVLFDSADYGECCHKFDFWVGNEGDAGNTTLTITDGDPVTLWWSAGNITSAMAEMDPAHAYDPTWPGIKVTDNTPFLVTHVPAPPPNHNSETFIPPSAGTYRYQLTGVFDGSLKTDTKWVEVKVDPAAPPVIDGDCGYACDTTHCEIPTEGFCTPPSTIAAPGTPQPTATGWEWVCEGLNGGLPTNPPCSVERQCGWVER